jgi:hypothetical protein
VPGVRDAPYAAGGSAAGECSVRAASGLADVYEVPKVGGGESLGACLYSFQMAETRIRLPGLIDRSVSQLRGNF